MYLVGTYYTCGGVVLGLGDGAGGEEGGGGGET